MKRIDSTHTNELRYRSSFGACGCVAGAFPAAFGAIMLLSAATGNVTLEGGTKVTGFSLVLIGFLGASALCVGLAIMFGGKRIILDRSAKTAVRYFTLFGIPFRARRNDIERFDCVWLKKNENKGDDGTTYTFPVCLGTENSAVIELHSFYFEEAARKFADEISAFLHYKLTDSIAPKPSTRPAAEATATLQERTRRRGPTEVGLPPAQLCSRLTAHGNSVEIEIPPRFTAEVFAPIIMALVFAVVGYFMFVRNMQKGLAKSPGSEIIVAIACGFFCLPLLITTIRAIALMRRKITVSADNATLRISTRGLLFSKNLEIPSRDVRDITVASRASGQQKVERYDLLVFAGDTTTRFGDQLAFDELNWLRLVLVRALTA